MEVKDHPVISDGTLCSKLNFIPVHGLVNAAQVVLPQKALPSPVGTQAVVRLEDRSLDAGEVEATKRDKTRRKHWTTYTCSQIMHVSRQVQLPLKETALAVTWIKSHVVPKFPSYFKLLPIPANFDLGKYCQPGFYMLYAAELLDIRGRRKSYIRLLRREEQSDSEVGADSVSLDSLLLV
ncbi:hypothetical protein CPB84DRAFT_1748123 [Gymnopilus junonius]|uniref:Uncharacterized protein n=1 Tax=Gymnopilus junonius TaxID=109634 RepID=A0A9P5NJ57_GYMJU|nr:hypothetical protein CPB84DRAFT_1748123 [Gymnopilus junonius]